MDYSEYLKAIEEGPKPGAEIPAPIPEYKAALATALRNLADSLDAYLPREDVRSPVHFNKANGEPVWCFGLHLAHNSAVLVERILNPGKEQFPGASPHIPDLDESIPYWQIRNLMTCLYVLYDWQEIPTLQSFRSITGFNADRRSQCPPVPTGFSDSLRLLARIVAASDTGAETDNEEFSGDTPKKYRNVGKMPSDQQSVEWLVFLQQHYDPATSQRDWMQQIFGEFMQNRKFSDDAERESEYAKMRQVATRYSHVWKTQ
jgi:hypothetical protein